MIPVPPPPTRIKPYSDFLESKSLSSPPAGFEPGEIESSRPFDFQLDVIRWACRQGRAALFEDCGLGKTLQQLIWAEQVSTHISGMVIIFAPLCVAEQTIKEAEKLDILVNHAQRQLDCDGPGIYITNYGKIHRFELDKFSGIVLDESSILKNYDGATRNLLVDGAASIPYRLACTATPAPNDFMEIGNHAEFLGIMSRVEMLATFFVHDGGDTAKWRLKGHAESEFWRWLCSWAVNLRKPSDLGYDDGRFILPALKIHEHVVETDHKMDGFLFPMAASTLQERRNARKVSIDDRVKIAAELANYDKSQWLIWCNLNAESKMLEDSINGAVEVCGSDSDEDKEKAMLGFTAGNIRVLVTKPSIAGFGMNWQHCYNMAFVGLSDSYEQFYQAVRRCWRFGQEKDVDAHIITSQLEGAVLSNIKRKESDSRRMAEEMVKHMAEISSAEIRGSKRESLEYNPKINMKLPEWL